MRGLILMTVLALAGCANVRTALGQYQGVADKGVVVGTAAESEAAAPASGAGSGKAARQDLPATLGGDKEHHVYSSEPK